MRLLHAAAKTHATFDDPNLVSHAGLVPAVRLAQNIGLEDLARRHVRVTAKVGANAGLKIGALVAGMVAGADTIDGMDLLRHGIDGARSRPRSAGSVPHPRWAAFCGRSTTATCASWPRCTAGYWSSWPRGPRCCPAPTPWRSSTSIRCSGGY